MSRLVIPTPRVPRSVLDCLKVYPDFLSGVEHDTMLTHATTRLARLARGPYNEGHFDNVIKGYKEASISSWDSCPVISPILERVKRMAESEIGAVKWLSPHVLELRDGDSGIAAHVDHLNVSFFGGEWG